MTSRSRRIALALLAPLSFASCLNSNADTGGNGFYISVPVETLTIPIGSSTTTVVSVARAGNFTGPIALTKISVPNGVTVTLSPDTIPVGVTESVMKISADSSLTSGSGNFGLRATGDPTYLVTLNIPLVLVSPATIKAVDH